MALKPEHLKQAKLALKSMSTRREKKLTKADFIDSLIQDIHAKMAAGFSLEDICAEARGLAQHRGDERGYANAVPFVAFRSLSDLAGGGEGANEMVTFLSLAADNSAEVVKAFL